MSIVSPYVAAAAQRAGIEYRRADYHFARTQSPHMAKREWERKPKREGYGMALLAGLLMVVAIVSIMFTISAVAALAKGGF